MNNQLELNPNKVVAYLGKPAKEFTKADIVRYIRENGVRMEQPQSRHHGDLPRDLRRRYSLPSASYPRRAQPR